MNRLVPGPYSEAIGEAFAVMPEGILARLRGVHFFTGTDPYWAGLFDERLLAEEATSESLGGRDPRATSCCSYPWHTRDLSVTIVLPGPVEPISVVHELGHALDCTLGFGHEASPVTDYARHNSQEAFAEAFVAWLYWYGDQDVLARDRSTLALFDHLAGWA